MQSSMQRLLLASIVVAAATAFASTQETATRTTEQDHQQMKDQLGIKTLRPAPSGRAAAGDPGAANYDPAKANPFPDLPDPLLLRNARRVTDAKTWWSERRPQIVEDFEREVYGRIPPNVPRVTWHVAETRTTAVGGVPVAARHIVGHVDNTIYPAIAVDIQMSLVMPAQAKGPSPVLIMFGNGALPPTAAATDTPPGPPGSAEQLIAAGWGYASIDPRSIQADNGAGLTKGIVGLVNSGRPRKPDDWGALRAWAWGASRALEYLRTDPAVDGGRIGVEGVSRYGKAALVAAAFDERFAVVLVGSSGEGGAKLHRRNFGEAVENLTAAGEYHWMAGNFLKYGAADAVFGSRNAGDLPVDSHELIALLAPRAVFISYGVPERGDANWLDHQGSYMAAVAAGPVFRLLGVKDLGDSRDYRTAAMPPPNTGLLDGALAWRQHDGGHEDRSNMKYFIEWANRVMAVRGTVTPVSDSVAHGPADRAKARTDQNSMVAHAQLLEKAKQGRIDVYFEGDSIVRRWGALDYPELLANWTANFFGWNAANFGWGADRTENILWRLENGELDGVNPKILVLLAGTNNVGTQPGGEQTVADVARGIQAIVHVCQQKAPNATIVLTAIFPRNDQFALMSTIDRINGKLAGFADGTRVRFLTINDRLADSEGRLFAGVLNARDKLHPTIRGYQIWADALKPMFRELLGPPAATDLAPPPTGDPSAAHRLPQ
jgi:(4-O-methyl)-D-glucuronate---lignin esterase